MVTDPSFPDSSNLKASTTYYYVVQAVAKGVASGSSNEASAKTQAPGPPSKVTATALSSSSIKLTWTPSTTDKDKVTYSIYRSTTKGFSASDGAPIEKGQKETSYIDGNLVGSKTFYYLVQTVAVANAVHSDLSGEATATTEAVVAPKDGASLFTRAVVGGNVSAGSSLATQTNFFIEANISTPAPFLGPSSVRKTAAYQCIDLLDRTSQAIADAGSTIGVLGDGQRLSDLEAACNSLSRADAQIVLLRGCYIDARNTGGLQEKCADVPAKPYNISADQYERAAAEIRRQYEYYYSPMAQPVWFWVNPRISAVPSQVSSLLSTVSTGSPSFNSLLNAKYDQLVQDFELHGGFEVRLGFSGERGWAHLGSSNRDGLYVVGSAGFDTPLSSTSNNAQIFTIPTPPSALQATQLKNLGVGVPPGAPICVDKTVVPPACVNAVGFIPPERSRFYYQDYFGLRLKSFYFKTKSAPGEYSGICDARERGELCPIFPGTFDITVGQNAAYSGGVVHDWMLRTELFFPLPASPYVHIFFTTWTHITGHNRSTTPLILDSAPSSLTLTSPGVQIVTIPELNRDFYRIGVGLDLVQFLKKFTSKAPASSTPSIATATSKTATDAAPKTN